MNEAFRYLHRLAALACELFAVFPRMVYALKGTDYASENEGKVTASWDGFAKDIEGDFKLASGGRSQFLCF